MSVTDSVALLRKQARLMYLEEEATVLREQARKKFGQSARKLADEQLQEKLGQIEALKQEIERIAKTDDAR